MDGPEIWHFTRTGLVKAICGYEGQVALEHNIVKEQYKFFDKPDQDRCPHCEKILLREENEYLKGLLKELQEICRKVLKVSEY